MCQIQRILCRRLCKVKTHHGNVCKWEPRIILKVCGPRNYLPRVLGKTRYIHIDHLRGTSEEIDSESPNVPPVQISVPILPESVHTPLVPMLEEQSPIIAPEVPVAPSVPETPTTPTPRTPVPQMPSQDREAGNHSNPTPRRNPPRTRVPPKRLDI